MHRDTASEQFSCIETKQVNSLWISSSLETGRERVYSLTSYVLGQGTDRNCLRLLSLMFFFFLHGVSRPWKQYGVLGLPSSGVRGILYTYRCTRLTLA